MGLSNEVNRTQSESHSLASQFVVAPFIRLKCVTFMFLHRQHPMKGWLAHSRDAHAQRHGTSSCKAEPRSSEALLPGLPLTIADKRRLLGLVLLIRVPIHTTKAASVTHAQIRSAIASKPHQRITCRDS